MTFFVLVSILFTGIIPLALSQTSNANQASTSINKTVYDAYKLRSANPTRANEILTTINRTQLNATDRDTYDFTEAYLLFIGGNLDESIAKFELLVENASFDDMRVMSKAALTALYGGSQKWNEALNYMNQLVENLSSQQTIEVQEQGHMAVINLYNMLDESQLIIDYTEPLLDEKYSLRFQCMVAFQRLVAKVEAKDPNLSSQNFNDKIERCAKLNEPIFKLGMHLSHSEFLINSEQYSAALTILNNRKKEVEAIGYVPLTFSLYDLLSQAYYHTGDYALAQDYGSKVVATGSAALVSRAYTSAYNTLYQIAETQGDYQQALALYKQFTEAKSQNITRENARQLAVEKARQDNIMKTNQITLLDTENSLLKAQAELDERAAYNRSLIILCLLLVFVFIGIWMYKRHTHYLNLRDVARLDGLTGIANRSYFTDVAVAAVENAKLNSTPISFIMFDLDDFKQINDSMGHQTGDAALQVAVGAAKKACRSSDLIGRLGGEEFGIFIEGCEIQRALELAQNCRKEIEAVSKTGNYDFKLTASFGLSSTAQAGYNFDKLYDAADKALYQSKRAGKNTVSYIGKQVA